MGEVARRQGGGQLAKWRGGQPASQPTRSLVAHLAEDSQRNPGANHERLNLLRVVRHNSRRTQHSYILFPALWWQFGSQHPEIADNDVLGPGL